MAIRFCPECKQMIPPGKLRGDSTSCVACFRRTSPDDLVLVDDKGKITENCAQATPQQPVSKKPQHKSMWDEDSELKTNDFLSEDELVIEKLRQLGRLGNEASVSGEGGNSNTLLKLVGALSADLAEKIEKKQQEDERFPEPMPLSQVKIPNNASWDYENGKQVLVLRSNFSSTMCFVGAIWLTVSLLLCLLLCVGSLSSASNFIDIISGIVYSIPFFAFAVVGVGILYLGIYYRYSKTWIEIEKDYLTIAHGLECKGKQICLLRKIDSILVKLKFLALENGKQIRLSRNADSILVNMKAIAVENHVTKYCVEMIDKKDSKRSVRLVDEASHDDALAIFNMAKALVVANID